MTLNRWSIRGQTNEFVFYSIISSLDLATANLSRTTRNRKGEESLTFILNVIMTFIMFSGQDDRKSVLCNVSSGGNSTYLCTGRCRPSLSLRTSDQGGMDATVSEKEGEDFKCQHVGSTEVSRNRPSLFVDSTVTLSVLLIREAPQDRSDAGGFCINTLNQRKRWGNGGENVCCMDIQRDMWGRKGGNQQNNSFFFLENRLREREKEPWDL